MDVKTISFGAAIGALIWEIVRQLISTIAKQTQDSKDLRRKMLREDIEYITGLVCEIHEASVGYYATEFGTEKAEDLSRQIKAKSKTAGMKLAAVNTQLAGFSKDTIEVRLWTSFKSAAAKHLDVSRADIWHDDDPRLNEIYKAAHHVHSSLNRVRYSNI
jgi:lambda repressor-like predicted transcriptional regulator